MPVFARLVKRLHEMDPNCEVLVESDYEPAVKWWLDTFALRWPWGTCTFDPDGVMLVRGEDYPEDLWSGDVVTSNGILHAALLRELAQARHV